MGAARFYAFGVGGLAVVVVASHLLGATALTRPLWGTHFYAFFPSWALMVSLAATLVALAWILFRRAPAAVMPSEAVPVLPRAWTVIALATLAGVLFWLLRLRHTLLGDSGVLSHDLPLGGSQHPRQPLAMLFHHYFYLLSRGLFATPGRPAADVAFDTVALEAVLTGVVFVPVILGLAREIATSTVSGVEEPPATGSAWIATALLAQGGVQLFFGYVENYAVFTLLLAVYLWTGLRFLNRRGPLLAAGAALMGAIGFDLAGVVLLPSLALLAAWGFARAPSRAAVARDLALTLVLGLALGWLLAGLGGATGPAGLSYILRMVVRGEGAENSLAYLLAAAHWRDFFAIHMLIGPFAGFLVVLVAIYRLATRRILDGRVLFLLVAALPAFGASWLFGDPLQGFPRDWDLFAPFAIIWTTAGLACVVWEPLPARAARLLLATIVVVSVFHTGSWVAINSCFDRSFARYKTLPISRGRTEMVVGFWYLNHGQAQDARAWFERSVAAYPANNAAQHQLGLFDMDAGHYREAVERFRVATLVRPDKGNYRLSLVDALVLDGRPGEALPELDRLAGQGGPSAPRQARLHACRGIVLAGLGRMSEAREALERARALDREEPRYRTLLARLDQPGFYRQALREDWDALILK